MDFENPEAETCWLSCLFQTLWHSLVFHQMFEEHLVQGKHKVGSEEKILLALQQTWEEYKVAGGATREEHRPQLAQEEGPISPPHIPARHISEMGKVSSMELAEAFGEGYGDMSEALALIQDELSRSDNLASRRLSEHMVMVPVVADADEAPGPSDAWKLVKEWEVTKAPLIAVDFSMPKPSRSASKRLAQLWVPREDKAAPDLGTEHKLVSLVCFMSKNQHYVAFCSRQQDHSRCIFFNDIPQLTPDAPREQRWSDVPSMCRIYGLTPRLAFFEAPLLVRPL